MRGLILNPLTLFLVLCGIVAFPFVLLLRPQHLRLGAAKKEFQSSTTGDPEISHASYQTTRGILLNASAEKVWPWIVLMGYRRDGWYGFDQMDNGGIPSANTILPEFQSLQIGQIIGEEGLEVRSIRANESLVLSFRIPIRSGSSRKVSGRNSAAAAWNTNLMPLMQIVLD